VNIIQKSEASEKVHKSIKS